MTTSLSNRLDGVSLDKRFRCGHGCIFLCDGSQLIEEAVEFLNFFWRFTANIVKTPFNLHNETVKKLVHFRQSLDQIGIF